MCALLCVTLSCYIVDVQDGASISSFITAVRDQVTSNKSYGHPYQYELEKFEPIPEQLELKDPLVMHCHFCVSYVGQ